MNDREMLEWAAKAAGYLVCRPFRNGEFRVSGQDGLSFAWNPRDDDGDALRLAVKMERESRADFWSRVIALRSVLDFMDDPYAATRRAIVRAAAEIGKSMP